MRIRAASRHAASGGNKSFAICGLIIRLCGRAPVCLRNTQINLSGGVNELTEGPVGAVDAAIGAGIGPYRECGFIRKSRLK